MINNVWMLLYLIFGFMCKGKSLTDITNLFPIIFYSLKLYFELKLI